MSNWTLLTKCDGKSDIYKCACGNVRVVDRYSVNHSLSKSCGCLRDKAMQKPNRQTKAYEAWRNMKARCTNPNNWYYKYYGGKGVQVCKEWHDFDNFFRDMGEPPKGKTLDRRDGNGNYCKDNCRWATRAEQQLNLRSNHNVTFNGETKCIAEWARVLKINVNTLSNRIHRGWPIEQALNPTKHQGVKIAKTACFS